MSHKGFHKQHPVKTENSFNTIMTIGERYTVQASHSFRTGEIKTTWPTLLEPRQTLEHILGSSVVGTAWRVIINDTTHGEHEQFDVPPNGGKAMRALSTMPNIDSLYIQPTGTPLRLLGWNRGNEDPRTHTLSYVVDGADAYATVQRLTTPEGFISVTAPQDVRDSVRHAAKVAVADALTH